MRSHLNVPSHTGLAVLCGVALAMGIAATPARADLWNHKTILTVNQPIQVTDTVLEPGQYVMKLFDSQSDRQIVQIFNRNETHIIDTVIAIPRERLVPRGHTVFTFWETPPGTYRALRTWFYPGENFGSEFPYPKHLQQIAMATTTTQSAANTTQNEAQAETNENNQQAETAPAPQPEQQPEQQPEVAQNTAPETPAPTQPAPPAELPKTASPYPAIGIAGFMLLGLAGLLKLRRTA